MRILSPCSALALLKYDCTCTTLHARTGRARSMIECAIPQYVVRRLFGEGTMLERFAAEMLRMEVGHSMSQEMQRDSVDDSALRFVFLHAVHVDVLHPRHTIRHSPLLHD